MSAAEPILSVRHLVTGFAASEQAGERHVLDDISFEIARGDVLAMVGQCGSGKTLTALSILRLLPPEVQQLGGEIHFAGRELSALSEPDMVALRGRGIGMVFQEPASALSPVHTVGWQLTTALAATGQVAGGRWGRGRALARERACDLLARVELPEPERLLDSYPHQLSAGMRRRVLIALALAGKPELLIADEPTTGLDATIQAQIIGLLSRLTREHGMSGLLITHDLSAVAELASSIVVMYAGQVVETGSVKSVFSDPQHPYTRALLADARRLAQPWTESDLVAPRRGLPPTQKPVAGRGCRFAEHCPERATGPASFPRCTLEEPELGPAGARHRCRCFYPRLSGPSA